MTKPIRPKAQPPKPPKPPKPPLPPKRKPKKKRKKKGESDFQTGLKAIKRGTSKSTRDALRMLDNY